MTNPHQLKVGQVLWFSSKVRYRTSGEVVIVNIGRKWATLKDGERVSLETLYLDGQNYSSPGRCWLSFLECETEALRQKAWSDLSQAIYKTYSAPDDCTLEAMQQAAKLLNLK